VFLATQSKRSTRASLEEDGARLTQERIVKKQLHDQMTRLRGSFLREDPRITGTVPKYLLSSCLKSGGMPATMQQCKETSYKFQTGDGRFNWLTFCEDIEKARSKSWKQANRLSAAKVFEEMDKDGSGTVTREELEAALKQLKVGTGVDQKTVEHMIATCDKDGDGNISFNEFVDGMAANLVAPDAIYQSVNTSRSASPRNSPRNLKSLRQAGGQFA